jgi:hypothetical protein
MKAPATPAMDNYFEAQPLLRHIRVMERFFREVVDSQLEYRKHLPDLHVAYMAILNEELAPHAVMLALAITELEDAFPDIEASSTGREER